jgi:hypothetical protein
MKRTLVALVVAVLLATTAQATAPEGDRSPGKGRKSFVQLIAEIFGLKPAGASRVTPPARTPNMACQTCDENSWTPSPEDCANAGLAPGCSYIRYCRNVPNDPRCSGDPTQY